MPDDQQTAGGATAGGGAARGGAAGEGGADASGPADAGSVYRRSLARWQDEAAGEARAERRMSSARIPLFLAAGALAWWAWARAPWGWPAPVAAFLGFGALVAQHGRVRERLDRARRAVAHHERNLDRLHGRWAGVGPDGAAYLPGEHVHARDLDLFGEASVFQLLCTARTRLGERTLAGWLLEPSGAADILERQQAVRELLPEAALRERLALLGQRAHDDLDPGVLTTWAARPAAPPGAWERPLALALGVLAGAGLLAWIAGAGLGPLGLVVLAESLVASLTKRRRRQRTEDAEAAGKQLALLAGLVSLVEGHDARAPRLRALAAALETGGVPPSARLARFERLAQAHVNARRNGAYALVSLLFQLEVHSALAIEAWRREVGPALPRWLQAAGEFEALCSLAAYAHENPEHAFPEIVGGAARLEAEALGHPLLPPARCVRNDVLLDGAHRLVLVTGSNMSGKSTLLRAVGVNVVLAQAGAPVCARRLLLSPCAVGASIRVLDSLREGASRFYAEILRLRAVLALTEGPRPVLFLLDEILQGTNSHDRRVASEAVVRELLARGAVGLVTTHDLALTELAAALGPVARNAHFADELRDGRLHFDYRMREGAVRRGNALELMRTLGFEV